MIEYLEEIAPWLPSLLLCLGCAGAMIYVTYKCLQSDSGAGENEIICGIKNAEHESKLTERYFLKS